MKKCSVAGCTSGTMYWTGMSSDALLESGVGGTGTGEYVFFNGKRVARRDVSDGAVHYYFADQLGSASVITNNVGVIQDESDYYPYGGEIVITNADSNTYKFTGKERDSESGLDNFGARYSSSHNGFAWAQWLFRIRYRRVPVSAAFLRVRRCPSLRALRRTEQELSLSRLFMLPSAHYKGVGVRIASFRS